MGGDSLDVMSSRDLMCGIMVTHTRNVHLIYLCMFNISVVRGISYFITSPSITDVDLISTPAFLESVDDARFIPQVSSLTANLNSQNIIPFAPLVYLKFPKDYDPPFIMVM